MFTLDEAVSTLQSSLQAFYGLFIGLMAVLSDLKDGKKIITTPTSTPTPSESQSTNLPSSSQSNVDNEVDNLTDCYINPNDEKGRVVVMIQNVLACWHFIVNLLYLVKRAVAVKVKIEDPEKIVINPMRVKKLTYKFHNWFMK